MPTALPLVSSTMHTGFNKLAIAVWCVCRLGEALGHSANHRHAEAFNTLVFSEIGYSITTCFILLVLSLWLQAGAKHWATRWPSAVLKPSTHLYSLR